MKYVSTYIYMTYCMDRLNTVAVCVSTFVCLSLHVCVLWLCACVCSFACACRIL